MKNKSIIRVPSSYLSSTKYLNKDTIIDENQKCCSGGTLEVSLNKTLIVRGTLICL